MIPTRLDKVSLAFRPQDILAMLRPDSCAECRFHLRYWQPKERDEVSGAPLPAKWVCLENLNMKEHNGVCSVGIRGMR